MIASHFSWRDNDQQNHWGKWGVHYFQTHPSAGDDGWTLKQVGWLWFHVKLPSKKIKHPGFWEVLKKLHGRRTSINDPWWTSEWYHTFHTGWNNVAVAVGELERWHLLFNLAWPYPHYQNCSGQHQQTLNPHSKFPASFTQPNQIRIRHPTDPGPNCPSNFLQAIRIPIPIPIKISQTHFPGVNPWYWQSDSNPVIPRFPWNFETCFPDVFSHGHFPLGFLSLLEKTPFV